MNKETPKLSTDSLLKTSKKVATELTEEQLEKVSGGTLSLGYAEIKFKYIEQNADGSGGTIPPASARGTGGKIGP